MKAVILCGGRGSRLKEETEFRPKPMLPIGNRPILWHIMKLFAHYGHREFVLCLGYKGEMIKEYFRNYSWNTCDVTVTLGQERSATFIHDGSPSEDWAVTLADTGENSMTAFRVRQIRKFVGDQEHFFLTYGDGVGNVDLDALVAHHRRVGKVCTLTGVHPPGRFGELGISDRSEVLQFNEKPQAEGGYINGGFMVCSQRLFDYLPPDPAMMLEQAPMKQLAADRQLAVFTHEGFWQPMDTYQEFTLLNRLWDTGQAPWKVW
jgi:glucose-1-phosphate cytidylyltransferase